MKLTLSTLTLALILVVLASASISQEDRHESLYNRKGMFRVWNQKYNSRSSSGSTKLQECISFPSHCPFPIPKELRDAYIDAHTLKPDIESKSPETIEKTLRECLADAEKCSLLAPKKLLESDIQSIFIQSDSESQRETDIPEPKIILEYRTALARLLTFRRCLAYPEYCLLVLPKKYLDSKIDLDLNLLNGNDNNDLFHRIGSYDEDHGDDNVESVHSLPREIEEQLKWSIPI